jgi:phosphoketolase
MKLQLTRTIQTMVGDGEAETGPLATSWHSTKFLNPIVDGAVLPVLHLNGYKINNPTVLARISHEELKALFVGYGWEPYFVEGSDFDTMHQAMAATMERAVTEIKAIQKKARDSGKAERPRWPMIVLRTPKGWSGPRKVDGHFLEGYWRAHQIPLTNVRKDSDQLALLEKWMRSYEPEKLFKNGKFIDELRDLAPSGNRRMTANPVANGGLLRANLRMPDFKKFAQTVNKPAGEQAPSMNLFADFLTQIVKANPTNFRLFGPDETQSNKLGAVYDVTQKVWMAEYFEEDKDGGNLAPAGRVMEILSEHTVEGWLEGYLLSGRHGQYASVQMPRARTQQIRLLWTDLVVVYYPAHGHMLIFTRSLQVCSTVTSLSFTSSTPWSISTQSGSRSAQKFLGDKRLLRSTSCLRPRSGVRITTDSLTRILVSLTSSPTSRLKSSVSTCLRMPTACSAP